MAVRSREKGDEGAQSVAVVMERLVNMMKNRVS